MRLVKTQAEREAVHEAARRYCKGVITREELWSEVDFLAGAEDEAWWHRTAPFPSLRPEDRAVMKAAELYADGHITRPEFWLTVKLLVRREATR